MDLRCKQGHLFGGSVDVDGVTVKVSAVGIAENVPAATAKTLLANRDGWAVAPPRETTAKPAAEAKPTPAPSPSPAPTPAPPQVEPPAPESPSSPSASSGKKGRSGKKSES